MTPIEARKLLRDFNAWRRDQPSPMTTMNINPCEIGIAMDMVLDELGGMAEIDEMHARIAKMRARDGKQKEDAK